MSPTALSTGLDSFFYGAVLFFQPIDQNGLFGLNPLLRALTLFIWTIHNKGSNQAISF